MLCSNVSPLAVRQRLQRRFRRIKSPHLNLVYDYPTETYWITDADTKTQYGPIGLYDLLPLARYFGAYRPAERCKTYALLLKDGTTIPEGKLRHKLHIQFTTKAMHDMQVQMRGRGGTVQQSTDATNVADPLPEHDPSKLYTSDVPDDLYSPDAPCVPQAHSASDVEYAEDLDPSP